MRHIKRSVYAEARLGSRLRSLLVRRGVTIEIDKDEPFVGYCHVNGKDYVVEKRTIPGQAGIWFINREYSKETRR